jgi:hypothetical protein
MSASDPKRTSASRVRRMTDYGMRAGLRTTSRPASRSRAPYPSCRRRALRAQAVLLWRFMDSKSRDWLDLALSGRADSSAVLDDGATSRAAKLGREANQRRDRAIAVVFMIDSSAEVFLSENRLACIRNGSCRVSITKPGTIKGVSKCRQILADSWSLHRVTATRLVVWTDLTRVEQR